MKKILIGLLLFSTVAIAQKKPSAAEMEKQMKAAQKEIDELEKVDPEAAKMAKQMLQQMQARTSQPATPPASRPHPLFASPITPVKTPAGVIPPTDAQATGQLLWYKGKKINDSMLITAKGSVILYNKKANRIVVQPKPGADPFKPVVDELIKSESRKQQLADQAAKLKNGFFYYPLIVQSISEMAATDRRFQGFLKNTIDLPLVSLPGKKIASLGKGGGQLEMNEEVDKTITEAYEKVLQMKDNAPGLEFPVPPSKQEDLCFDCNIDSAASKYNTARKNWDSLFTLYEKQLTERAIAVIRMIELGWNEGDAGELGKMRSGMYDVMKFAFRRSHEKLTMLEERYGKDYERLPVVIEMMIAIERQEQLIGLDDFDSNVLEKTASYLNGFDQYLRREMDNRNYNLVFNIPFILGMERQKQLVGVSDSEHMEYFAMVEAFNRFRLELSIDFEEQFFDSEGEFTGSASGEVKENQKVYVSLGRYDCKYQLHLTNTSYGESEEKEYRIPMEIKGGTKVIKNDKGEFIKLPYSGPKMIYDVFPTFRIDFCDNKMDSAYLSIPVYEQDMQPFVSSVSTAYTIDFLGYMAQLFYNVKEMEGKIPDIKEAGAKMMQSFGSNHLEKPTGYASLDKMQQDYNLSLDIEKNQLAMSELTVMNKFLFLFDAHNNNNVLVDETNNAARVVDEKMKITKAIVHIRITHDPDEIPPPKRKPLVRK